MRELLFGAWQPRYFNQNGELANIKVLQRWLALAGVQAFSLPITATNEIPQLDFLLIGDSGRAAIRHFAPELLEIADLGSAGANGPHTLVLGKSFELVAESGFGLALAEAPRVSEAREFASEFGTVRGYLNSRREPVGLVQSGRLFGSSLHGPILASSPGLRAKMLTLFGLDATTLLPPAEISALERDLGWI